MDYFAIDVGWLFIEPGPRMLPTLTTTIYWQCMRTKGGGGLCTPSLVLFFVKHQARGTPPLNAHYVMPTII